MDNLFTLILIGAVLFLMFRKRGIGCCGAHSHGNHGNRYFGNSGHIYTDYGKAKERQPEIIDLSKDDYQVLPFDE